MGDFLVSLPRGLSTFLIFFWRTNFWFYFYCLFLILLIYALLLGLICSVILWYSNKYKFEVFVSFSWHRAPKTFIISWLRRRGASFVIHNKLFSPIPEFMLMRYLGIFTNLQSASLLIAEGSLLKSSTVMIDLSASPFSSSCGCLLHVKLCY